jgi:adenylate cyclase
LEEESLIHRNILENVKDGIMTVDFDGKIITFNPAAESILEINESDLLNQNYAEVFFQYEENDEFNQTIFNAIYESAVRHNSVVSFNTGRTVKSLALTTTYLQSNGKDLGVIAVFSDITELSELRDSLKAMEKIQRLNSELEKRNEFIKETFGRYLSDDIVKSIIETPGGLKLGGKKQRITIMMTDLRGFTSMSEKLQPEAVVSILNNYLGEMTEIILKHGGTIDEFIGDAILVLFGAPVWHQLHAERAVACALEMQIAMAGVNRWNKKMSLPEIEMGIGIHTGDVVIGNIGSKKRTKYGVVGKAVNLTSRIESYTTGGQIFISRQTGDEVGNGLVTGARHEVHPKGVEHPITILEVTGLERGYGLSLDADEAGQRLLTLKKPIAVRVDVVEGKDVGCGEGMHNAWITKLSRHRAEIAIEAGAEAGMDVGMGAKMGLTVKAFDNLRMRITGANGEEIDADVYAKALEAAATGSDADTITSAGANADADAKVRIKFTSLPEAVRVFFDGIVEGE